MTNEKKVPISTHLVALASRYLALVVILAGCSQSAPLSERELATRVLAQAVAKKVSPKKVLVVSNPFSREAGRSQEAYKFEQSGITGLKDGFGEGVKVEVDFPALKPETVRDPSSIQVDAQTTTPLSFFVGENAFSELARKHSNADVIVSLIGLPVHLGAFKEWSQSGKPHFALLLPDWRMIGGREKIVQAFRSGKLIAAVVRRPNAPEGNATGEAQAEFDARYWLVTADNVESLVQQNPAAFGLR
ncbi:MAG TPA: hypothetical protein VF773_00095 [Verrucomicrobiae bacterium]